MKKRILSLLLAFLMLFSMFPAYSTYAVETGKEVSVWYFNSVSEAMEEADAVELYRGGELYLSAILRDDISGDIQWQIEANQDFWVDIQGGTAEDLRVSYGMVQSLLGNDSVRMRCAVLGDKEYYSDPFTVVITDVDNRLVTDTFNIEREQAAPDPLPAPVGVPNETEPIADDEAEPEVTEETEPAATEETEPAATEETEPETTEETEPAATEETEPAATEETEPAATEETEPAATEETEPAATEETEPVVTEETEPAATEETEPVVTEETEPVTAEEAGTETTEETLEIQNEIVPLASSSTARIMLLSSVTPAEEPAADSLPDENTTIYTVTIEYVYADGYKFAGQRVALPYVYEATAGQIIDQTVTSPNCIGYSPDNPSINLADQGAINRNINLTVKYAPAQVSYTVRHYLQNVDNDEYTWVDTTLATGYTEANTSDSAANSYEGFTALSHYHEEIAADSSTTIDIYYDRNYYLISFDLDGGYGVDPIYARYGAEVYVADPQRAGWTFAGWDQTIPATMPSENRTFTAKWTANDGVSFTIAYWLEDPNNAGTYHYWASATQEGTTGNPVNGEDYKDYTAYLDESKLDEYERRYSYYDHADSNVTIKGDGSTVVNVYYNRKEYTLKFYYAMSSGSGTNTKYYVIGGSTYYFGAKAGIVDKANEISLLDQYMSTLTSQRGEVDEMPDLNDKGKSRNYTTGSDSSTVNGTAYTYYYISFKAKYGADTSNLWPCDVFDSVTRTTSNTTHTNWSGTEAYVSAWNGEHHVWYTQNNTNQTIKGNYNELDYKLLWDDTKFGDADTVSYLCFWENGADISWSVPELYRYNIYVQNTTGTDYELLRTYDTVDDSDVRSQTAPANNGFTYSHMEGQNIPNPDPTKYKEAYAVNFYYTRDQFALTLVNGSTTVKTENVYYQADLSGYTSVSDSLTYHDSQQKDYYEFAGWYTTPDAIPGTEYTLTGATMPGSALTLYAHWELINHDVSVYLTEADADAETKQIGETVSVTHDTLVPESSRPDESTLKNEADPDATFIGWFYQDENNEEQAFSFATMTITQDMKVYAKWRSNVMKKVTVRYVVVDDSGNKVAEIADAETLMLRVGSTRTFAAKTGVSLYKNYRTGCFPTTASHSITPTADDSEIVYVFEYKQFGAVAYTVKYKVMMDDGTLRPAFQNVNGNAVFVEGTWNSSYTEYVEKHNDNDKAVVTELYIPSNLNDATWTLPDAYVPNALKIQKVIIPGEDNTITFIYRYAPTEALYTVNHYVQNAADPTQYDLYSFAEYSGTIGETVTAAPISIPGHTYSKDVTQSNMANGNTLTNEGMSGTVNTNDTLALNFYYTVNPYPYQIMYLEKDTNRVLLETKTVDADNKPLTGLYGAQVSYTLGTTEENALLADYDVDAATKSIYIQMEAGGTANVNTIVFYYTRKSANLIISKTVELDTEQAQEEGITTLPEEALQQEFVFTIYCPTGFHKSVYDYTLTDGENKTEGTVIAGTTTMPLSLKSGQAVAIHDLAMGEYTVTETYVPGFRTSVNGTIQQSCTVELKQANQDVTTPFVNTYPFYTGDLVVKKNVAKLDNSDPDAANPYQVRVTLTPEDAAREVDRVITWTDSDGTKKTFTVPKLIGSADQTIFTIDISVPTGGEVKEVKMEGVPVGSFKVEELTSNDIGYITDYYKVTYNKALHQNDEVKGTYDAANGITGEIHGGHPTAVTFTNTYKKGSLTIQKTVTQEYENDNWQSDTFTFTITGTTELPDGHYTVEGATVTVSNGTVTVKDASGNDPTITVTRTDDATSWNGSLTFTNLPAGYYTVNEISSTNGLDKYTTVSPAANLLVNDTANETEANFTNKYKRHYLDLTITTNCADYNQSFIFDVSATGTALGDIHLTVVLVGNDSQTIRDLPVGEYTVTEQTDWSWRETSVDSKPVVLQTQSVTVPFNFGAVDRIYWLSGYSYRKNGGG